MKEVNTFLEKFQNPILWIMILGLFGWSYAQMIEVPVIKERLQKKIVVINNLEKDHHAFELKMNQEIHALQLKLKDKELKDKEKNIEFLEKLHEIEIKTIHNNYK
jgi:hypothetical protein